jgi:hypothetical protein
MSALALAYPMKHLGKATVGRVWVEDWEQDGMVWSQDPYAAGVRFAERIFASHSDTLIDYWQGLNEPPIVANRVARFELGFTHRMHQAGKKTVVVN